MTIIELERELLQLGISDDLYSIMTGGLPNEKTMYRKKRINGRFIIVNEEIRVD